MQEDDGWIFVRDGGAFAAVKVVSGGYAWTPAWKHAESATADNRAFITLKAEHAPVILIANQASDYQGNFDAFKTAVKARPIHYADGVLRFETITFYGPAKPPEISGKPVNLAPSRGYDSPFVRSDWGSGLIHICKGSETVILDFRDPQNPRKTLGAPATAEFPPGVGNVPPVILSKAAR